MLLFLYNVNINNIIEIGDKVMNNVFKKFLWLLLVTFLLVACFAAELVSVYAEERNIDVWVWICSESESYYNNIILKVSFIKELDRLEVKKGEYKTAFIFYIKGCLPYS